MDDDALIKIANVIASFHRGSCYPEADPIELEIAARAALAVARAAILKEALRAILTGAEGKPNDAAYGMHEAGRLVADLAKEQTNDL